mgnify:FL=1
MNVLVFCEHNPSMDSPEGKAAYPEGLGECLAQLLRGAGHTATLLPMGEQGVQGFSDELLDGADVAFWWAHCYHGAVQSEIIDKVVDRVHRGMGMVFLHSSHLARPFLRLIGTTGFLTWREAGERERLWCVDPSHPIAAGLGDYIDIPQEEMYGEPFGIPTPDELVYIGWFEGGEVFRAGCVFKRGLGKLFYFNPGHETYPTYRIPAVRKLLVQACEYVAPKQPVSGPLGCSHRDDFCIDRSVKK